MTGSNVTPLTFIHKGMCDMITFFLLPGDFFVGKQNPQILRLVKLGIDIGKDCPTNQKKHTLGFVDKFVY